MFNFSELSFFDNHTHLLNNSNREIDIRELIRPLAHGYGDLLPAGIHFGDPVHVNVNTASDEYMRVIVANLSVVKTLVHYLSQRFGCAPDIDVILKIRNSFTSVDMPAYTKSLFEEENIIGEVVDSALPMGDSKLNCFPTKIYRLFQLDPLFTTNLKLCVTYGELLDKLDAAVRAAIKEGYIGVKYHVLEKTIQLPHLVEKDEAKQLYDLARGGDSFATEQVYYAVFAHMLGLTQELDFPIHIHTGITGKTGHGLVHNYDPLYFCPLLNSDRFFRSHIVFLHCSYPNTRNVAIMANTYPNIWLDISQILPWVSVNFPQIIEEVLGIAPHSKIMFGTGAHDHPEIIWMAAKIAKSSLETVMKNAVERGIFAQSQAHETAELLLYKNALRLYGN
jgi:hypothetical protein